MRKLLERLFLLEANWDRDHSQRLKYSQVYARFVKELKGKTIKIANGIAIIDGKNIIDDENFVIYFYFDEFVLGKTFARVVFDKGDKSVRKVYFSVLNGRDIKSKKILGDDIIDRLERDIFIHEMDHVFSPGTNYLKDRISKIANTDKRSGYYNSPQEWNAFWQSGADKLEQEVDSLPIDTNPKTIRTMFGDGTFQGFRNKVVHYWDNVFIKNLDDIMSRKFDKRLYQMWIVIKDKVFGE